tara:strand:+ start:1025 stop:1864 length:840 start_codon:yes stop_codon:yes gene_type:complete
MKNKEGISIHEILPNLSEPDSAGLNSAKKKLKQDGQESLTHFEAKAVLDYVVYETRCFLDRALSDKKDDPFANHIKSTLWHKEPSVRGNILKYACDVATTYADHIATELGLQSQPMHTSNYLNYLSSEFKDFVEPWQAHCFLLVNLNVAGKQREFMIDTTFRQFCSTVDMTFDSVDLQVTSLEFREPLSKYDAGARLALFKKSGMDFADQILKHGYVYWGAAAKAAYLSALLGNVEVDHGKAYKKAQAHPMREYGVRKAISEGHPVTKETKFHKKQVFS